MHAWSLSQKKVGTMKLLNDKGKFSSWLSWWSGETNQGLRSPEIIIQPIKGWRSRLAPLPLLRGGNSLDRNTLDRKDMVTQRKIFFFQLLVQLKVEDERLTFIDLSRSLDYQLEMPFRSINQFNVALSSLTRGRWQKILGRGNFEVKNGTSFKG